MKSKSNSEPKQTILLPAEVPALYSKHRGFWVLEVEEPVQYIN